MCEPKSKGGTHAAVMKEWPHSNIFNKVVFNIELIIIIIIISNTVLIVNKFVNF
jgi:hypothetical protein